MAKNPFENIDDDVLGIDVSSLKRNTEQKGGGDTFGPSGSERRDFRAQRPTAAEIAHAAALDGFTTRDGTGKVDGRSLRRTGRTTLISVRLTKDCKDMIEEIITKKGKPFTRGQLIEEALELWIKDQSDPELIQKFKTLKIHGGVR